MNDTGIGISETDKDKLFKLFGFIDKENLNTSGIGLGLVISQLIIKELGGVISFSSVEGKGSRFFFKLKIGSSEPEDSDESSSRSIDGNIQIFLENDVLDNGTYSTVRSEKPAEKFQNSSQLALIEDA